MSDTIEINVSESDTVELAITDGDTVEVNFYESLPQSLNWFIDLIDTDYLENANYLLD